ncbi:DinB family protein [Pseudonocardia sp. KRD-169]|uniref:DinB family protein n=1 Tax=Pseudonocardia abyssalis TaxID=2792008 RepID=A0ABS6UXL5_9PSEU|nr:DinB family protein [Pseudonocardia abyssalis]MBW0136956.1 DinB family protein [Pseudonocardia abyssalis]
MLRWQFELTWSLLELHLDALEPADVLWEPAAHVWTVRPGDDGWIPDWADAEPDPIPVPTIGWVTWHIGWWWSVALDHAQGRPPRDRMQIRWPGDLASTVAWLRALRVEWLSVLDGLTDADLDDPAPFPWPPEQGLRVAHMIAWVTVELTKNVSEIGQLRLVRATGQPSGGRGAT